MNTGASWPPIIAFARATGLVRIRDILLTAAAWARLVYLMRDGLWLILDYFSYPIFQLTHPHSADWMEVWDRMSTFLVLSVVAMLWLSLWGLIHRRRLQFAAHIAPPPELALEEHAADFHLDLAAVERAREARVAVVQFDAAHRIISLSPH
jgi:poly-beta-1,6-N-acetyl-D-glucosamine biosynthesis protein PgaD